jgi:hypothetical protein
MIPKEPCQGRDLMAETFSGIKRVMKVGEDMHIKLTDIEGCEDFVLVWTGTGNPNSLKTPTDQFAC